MIAYRLNLVLAKNKNKNSRTTSPVGEWLASVKFAVEEKVNECGGMKKSRHTTVTYAVAI
jgi:hypothetical protein